MMPRVSLLRILAFLGLTVLYYALDWSQLQHALAIATATLSGIVGTSATAMQVGGDFLVVFDSGVAVVTPNCTYIDLAAIIALLTWQTQNSLAKNLAQAGLITVIVLTVNLLRSTAAIVGFDAGWSWFAAHALPDYLLYYVTVTIFAFLAIRNDFESRRARPH